MRAQYRYVDWRLTASQDTTGFTGKCSGCDQASKPLPSSDAAQVWCLNHAGATGHRIFELTTAQRFTAEWTE
jgi:hypothetical protein